MHNVVILSKKHNGAFRLTSGMSQLEEGTALNTHNKLIDKFLIRLLQKQTGRITRWVNGHQKQRWLAMSLLKIESRLNKIKNYRKLSLLKIAIKNAISNVPKKPLQNFNSNTNVSRLKKQKINLGLDITLPDSTIINYLINKGYVVLINDNGTIPLEIKSLQEI
jgi:hypothetical protein